MKEIPGFNHVGLRIRDLARSQAFYEKLGFDFIIGPIGPEPVAVMEHLSGVNINFILNARNDASGDYILMDIPAKQIGYTHMALEINDRESVKQQLTKAGV